MPFVYGFSPLDFISGSLYSLAILCSPLIVYWIVTFIAYVFTPVEERRLELRDEQAIDSLRTWSFRAKQTATLTNMKLYQSGVFRYGKPRRAVVIPLDNIDSVGVSSGRNIVWLTLAVLALILLILDLNAGARDDSSMAGYTILATIIFAALYWLSGSRRLVVRSKTGVIVVDASIINIDLLDSVASDGGGPVSDNRIYAFANRIQSMIVKPRDADLVSAVMPQKREIRLSSGDGAMRCRFCNAVLVPESAYCDECGGSVAPELAPH